MSVYTLKDKLTEFRRRYHLTQYNIAELTNIPQPTISLIERGEKVPLIYEEKLLLDLIEGRNPKAQEILNRKQIGINLKHVLRIKGYTESSFAKLTGLTKRQILNIENGNIDLTDENNKWLLRKITVPNIINKSDLFIARNGKELEKIEVKTDLDEDEIIFADRIANRISEKILEKDEAFKDKDLNNLLMYTLYNGLSAILSQEEQDKIEEWINKYLK